MGISYGLVGFRELTLIVENQIEKTTENYIGNWGVYRDSIPLFCLVGNEGMGKQMGTTMLLVIMPERLIIEIHFSIPD